MSDSSNTSKNAPKFCPVCGYEMDEPPWANDKSASLEICSSCRIQFGYTDMAGGDVERRKQLHKDWREKWIEEGMPWRSTFGKPDNWDPVKQLTNIGIRIANES